MIRIPIGSIEDYFAYLNSPQNSVELARNAKEHEALLIASPSLVDSLYSNTDAMTPKRLSQIRDSVERYRIRMTTRTTPFGAFSGVGLGHISDNCDGKIHLDSTNPPHPVARLDMQYLLYLIQQIEELDSVRYQLRFFSNPALFEKGGRIWIAVNDRYGQAVTNVVASARISPPLKLILEHTTSPVAWQQIFELLQTQSPNTDSTTIISFLDNLWRQGIVLSTLRPPLTAQDPISWVINKLQETSYRGNHYQHLLDSRKALHQYNKRRLGKGKLSLESLYRTLEYVPGNKQTVLAIDTSLSFKRRDLPRVVLEKACRAAELLLRVSPGEPRSHILNSYRAEFIERYGEQEIPILELLDEEAGLGAPWGYRNPPSHRVQNPGSPAQTSVRDNALLTLAGEALRRGIREVVLDDDLISQLESTSDWKLSAPSSADFFAFIAAEDQANVIAGNYQMIVAPRAGTYPAGRSFGRFCHVMPEHATSWLKARARKEEATHPEILFADLIYNHAQGHATNVALRPQLYSYQISLSAPASVQSENRIALNDILVGASRESFYLKSQIYGKRLLVRSMHLLNFLNAPNVCRFLQEVSDDGTRTPSPFDWGKAKGLQYLPRIRYGQTILSVARWQIADPSLYDTFNWVQKFSKWRNRWDVPRFVYLTRADNRLLLDLEHPKHLELLQRDTQISGLKHQQVMLEEAIPGTNEAWIRDNTGHTYMSEFVFTMEQKSIPQPAAGSFEGSQARHPEQLSHYFQPSRRLLHHEERIKPPSNEWVYFKLYGGKSRQNEVLELLSAPLEELSSKGVGWFFIRYGDPHPHLRVRLFSTNTPLLAVALAPLISLLDQILKDGLLNRFSIDTYDRELERYGGVQGLRISEQLFHLDSRVVQQLILHAAPGKKTPDLDKLGVISVDYLFRGFGLSVDERRNFYQRIRLNQQQMLGIQDTELGEHFRKIRASLWEVFRPDNNILYEILTQFQDEVTEFANALQVLEVNNRLLRPIDNILASHVHMHCNRLGLNRHDEFKVVYFLSRLYDGFRHFMPSGILL